MNVTTSIVSEQLALGDGMNEKGDFLDHQVSSFRSALKNYKTSLKINIRYHM